MEGEREKGGAMSLTTLELIVQTQWVLLRINCAFNEIVKYWLKVKYKYELKVLN